MRRVVVSLGLLSVLVACQPPDLAGSAAGRLPEGVSGRIELPAAPATGPALVTVHLHDADGPLIGAKVTVTRDMTHAGMVPVISETTETAPGAYQTEDFRITMGAAWFLPAAVELADRARERPAPLTTGVSSN